MMYPETPWIEAHEFIAWCHDERDATDAVVRERWLIPIEARFLSQTADRDETIIFGEVDEASDDWRSDGPKDPWADPVAISSIVRFSNNGRVGIVTAWDVHYMDPDEVVWIVVRGISRDTVRRVRWDYPVSDKFDPAVRPAGQ